MWEKDESVEDGRMGGGEEVRMGGGEDELTV